MRLRSLLLGIMITGAFVACSNDDVNPNVPVEGETATLSVQIANVKTKALGDNKKDDKTISELSVLVFSGTGNDAVLETIGNANATATTTGTVSEVKDIAVEPGNKQVLVLANVSGRQLSDNGISKGATLSSILTNAKLLFSAAEVNGNLSMNSRVYTVSLSAGKVHYLGYDKTTYPTTDSQVNLGITNDKPVYLYRNVSKAVLSNITFKPLDRYPNATFTLKEVFILHGHQDSRLVGEEGTQWGSTNITDKYFNGSSMADYKKWATYMDDYKELRKFNYIPNENTALYNEYSVTDNTYKEAFSNVKMSANGELSEELKASKAFYMYENTDIEDTGYHTLLVVKGDFAYNGVGEEEPVVSRDRYYTVALGLTGIAENGYTLPDNIDGLSGLKRNNADRFKGLLRNLQYNVSMEIKGPGYTTPFGPDNLDDTFVGIQVQVVALKWVYQKVDIGGE